MTRLAHAYRALTPEQRLAALSSLGLFVSMLLPWYSKADTLVVHGAAKATDTSLSAFQAFSFVEAAVLLVSAAVLGALFARAEGRDFPLPGGDGIVVMIAGGWAALLIFYRLLDKPGLQGNERVTATVGVEWGIFIALLLALGLAYAGARMRALRTARAATAAHARYASPPARGAACGAGGAPTGGSRSRGDRRNTGARAHATLATGAGTRAAAGRRPRPATRRRLPRSPRRGSSCPSRTPRPARSSRHLSLRGRCQPLRPRRQPPSQT